MSEILPMMMSARWLLILLVFIGPSASWAREVGPNDQRTETIESRVTRAKVQVLNRVRHTTTKSDFMWYPPSGLAIFLSQAQGSQSVVRSISVAGLSTGNLSYEYSDTEASALKSGGTHRVFSVRTIKADQVISIKLTVQKGKNLPLEFEKTLPIKKDSLPIVAELVLTLSERKTPVLVVTTVPGSDLSRTNSIFSENIQFLIETHRYLESAVLLLAALDQPSIERSVREGWQLMLAEVYIAWDLDEEAAVLLREVATKTKSGIRGATAFFYLGKLDYQKGQYRQATDAFNKARVDLSPSLLPEILYLSGNSHLHRKTFQEAIQVLNQVPSGSSFYPYAIYSGGLAYLNSGDVPSTIRKFQELLELDSKGDPLIASLRDRARMSLGFFLVDQMQFEKAIEVFGNVPPGSLYEDQTRFGIGWAYFKMGQCDKAVAIFEQLVLTWPSSVYSEEARLKIGMCYSSLGAYRKAVESYRESLRVFSQRHEKLETVRQHLYRASLEDWIVLQREEFRGPGKKNPFIRELSADGRIQGEISDYEEIALLTVQVEQFSKELGGEEESSPFEVLLNHLRKVKKQVEDDVKNSVSERILEFQSVLEERAVQADIGLLKNFNLVP